jgi:hypothetical protein
VEAFAKEKRQFERMTVSRDFALQMFAYNDFKRYGPSGMGVAFLKVLAYPDRGYAIYVAKSSRPFPQTKS